MSNTQITPGAVVTGTYHGMAIIGRVVHMSDWSPGTGVLVTVRLDGQIALHAATRDTVCIALSQLTTVDGCELPAVAGQHGWRLTEAA